MAAVQEICARIGLQTSVGVAENIRKYYPRPVLYVCVGLLVIANIFNLGTDLGAMAAAAQLLLGLPFLVWLAAMTLLSMLLEIFVEYKRYARVLRVLAFSLLAYIFVVVVVPQDWGQALRGTVIPSLQFTPDYLLNIVAILGTTISPYLFFWQANEEVEEQIDAGRTSEAERQGITRTELKWMSRFRLRGMVLRQGIE